MWMRKSLAFVPSEEVTDYFDVFKRNLSEMSAPIVKWFGENYVNGNDKGYNLTGKYILTIKFPLQVRRVKKKTWRTFSCRQSCIFP